MSSSDLTKLIKIKITSLEYKKSNMTETAFPKPHKSSKKIKDVRSFKLPQSYNKCVYNLRR